MTRLTNVNLERLDPSVATPRYDRARVTPGIVHIGVGGFHRAHQAMYLDELMNRGEALDWGIVGVGMMPGDTRMRDAPATLPIGQGQLFPKLEKGIAQMEVGEKKTFELKCAEAYGERKDEAVQKFPASPEEVAQLKAQVQPGQMVQLPDRTSAICVAIEDDGVVLDLNHPLSGKDLTFEIELVDVADGPKLFGVPIVPFDPNKVVKKE